MVNLLLITLIVGILVYKWYKGRGKSPSKLVDLSILIADHANHLVAAKAGAITPYIKQTKIMHESGFHCFEVGYCGNSGQYTVLGRNSDHVWMTQIMAPLPPGATLNMDIDKEGRIRFYRKWAWDTEIPMSTADLTYVGD